MPALADPTAAPQAASSRCGLRRSPLPPKPCAHHERRVGQGQAASAELVALHADRGAKPGGQLGQALHRGAALRGWVGWAGGWCGLERVHRAGVSADLPGQPRKRSGRHKLRPARSPARAPTCRQKLVSTCTFQARSAFRSAAVYWPSGSE